MVNDQPVAYRPFEFVTECSAKHDRGVREAFEEVSFRFFAVSFIRVLVLTPTLPLSLIRPLESQ